jgi:hypothetical protein
MSIFSRFNKINWIADILTPLAVILTEVFWLYPWLVYFGQNSMFTIQKTALSPLSLIITLGFSFIVTRFFLKQKWPMIWIQTVIVACGLIVIFLILRNEYNDGSSLFSSQWFATYGQVVFHFFASKNPFVLALVAGLYFWWRGISLGRSHFYFEDIYHTFMIELALMVLLVIMWGFSFQGQAVRTLNADIVIYIIGFFFFGLVAMALSNLRIVQERLKTKGESSKNFSRKWLSIILTVIVGMVLLGIGFASIFSSQFISVLQGFMKAVSNVYDKVVLFLLYAVGFIVQLLSYIYQWLINLITKGKPPEQPTIEIGPPPNKINGNTPQPFPAWIITTVKITFFVAVAGAALFLIMKAVRRWRNAQTEDDTGEENESLWSWGGFVSDIKVFLKMLFDRFKGKPKPAAARVPVNWQSEEDIKHRLSIREIYQHLLWQGSRLRIPREDFETPSEYALRLGHAVPESSESLHKITGLYLDVRYGEQTIEEKTTDDANIIWQNLLSIFNRPAGE